MTNGIARFSGTEQLYLHAGQGGSGSLKAANRLFFMKAALYRLDFCPGFWLNGP